MRSGRLLIWLLLFLLHISLFAALYAALGHICGQPDLPHCNVLSAFARPRLAASEISSLNDDRYKKAAHFFASSARGPGHLGNATMAVAVTTAKRRLPANALSPHFLTQTLGELLAQLDRFGDSSIVPLICQMDDDAETQDISAFFHVVQAPSTNPISSNSTRLAKIKERRDYTFCLNASLHLALRADWILVIEDDGLLVHNFFPRLMALIAKMRFLRAKTGSPPATYVKLHHPESLRKLPWLVHATIAAAMLSLPLPYLLGRRPLAAAAFCLQLGLWLWALVSLGPGYSLDAGLEALGGVRLGAVESCCTLGVLYSRQGARGLLGALAAASGSGLPKDSVLDGLSGPAFQTASNLLRHIGTYSSLHSVQIQPDQA